MGYSIWRVSLIASHIKEDLTTTQGMSTSQPRRSQGSIRNTPSRLSSGELEDTFRSTRTPTVLGYEELGGLSDPGTRNCARGILFLRYGMGHGPRPISVVTTRSVVGHSRKLPEKYSGRSFGLVPDQNFHVNLSLRDI
jgi:hypothetical protein